jgi:2-polyprenyl-6-methoxyphenol hydroxylase-like FAD-dependent oxidoreductase
MTKALIIGGGIAGPATAIALHKAGISAAVYEAYPADASDDAGAFLTIAANGQDALQAIDVLEPVLDASFPARQLRMFDAAGTKLADAVLGRDHPCPQTITRASLSRILCDEATRCGVPLAHGKRLTGVTSRGGQVTAFFADGSSAEADVLIGADGIHSLVRTLIDPVAPAPRYVGLTIACGYADHTQADGDLDGYQMIYGSRGFFGHTTAPDGRTWWFARIPGAELTAADLSAPADHWRKTLADTFAEDNSPAADIINSTRDRITITSAYDIPTLPTWHNDSMVVIGDAAHAASPSTAQGASMALEDAVILAQCLRDHPAIPDALTVYESLRRERVEHVVRSGANATNPKPPTPGSRQPSSVDWLFKHHINWNAPVDANLPALRSRP